MRMLHTSTLSGAICCLLLLLMGCSGSQTSANQGTSQSSDQETNILAVVRSVGQEI